MLMFRDLMSQAFDRVVFHSHAGHAARGLRAAMHGSWAWRQHCHQPRKP